jgi:phage replication-related protein YjqB (UPF0714/DUF867 family)
MADKYSHFAELAENEVAGVDYRTLSRRATPSFVIVAPHGGGIEPGTSEIADAIAEKDIAAGTNFSFYTFEGIKPAGNAELHITSTHFDEPVCLTLIRDSDIVITIHGEHSDEGEGVFVGGLDKRLGRRIGRALKAAGFNVSKHQDPDLQGIEPANLCNRGKTGAGVQLELSQAVRRQMFASLTRTGRKITKPPFRRFVNALRASLKDGHKLSK